jgi:hypothetical protein
MKFQEIFNEYIELLPYMVEPKQVFTTTTLYNSYIKDIFGNKEVSTLLITDYQNFANDLLLPNDNDDYISRDHIEQIIDILISISRYGIKSNYGLTENLPQQINIDFNFENDDRFEEELENIQLVMQLGEAFLNLAKTTSKITSYSKVA